MSLDYHQRKRISPVDEITIQGLYQTGEAMALHSHHTCVRVVISDNITDFYSDWYVTLACNFVAL